MRITEPLLPEDKDPNADFYLSQSQRSDLAEFIERCDIYEANLKTTEKAFKACNEKKQNETSWWQKPTSVVGMVIVSILSGLLIGELQK